MNKRMRFAHESSSLNLVVMEDDAEGHIAVITNLFSGLRNQGHASGLMTKVLAYTDTAGLTVYLEAKRYGHPVGIDNQQLQRFYEKFGFVRVDDDRVMRRAPSQDLHGSL